MMLASLGSAEDSGPAPTLQNQNFLSFAQAAFDAKFGALLAENILRAITQHLCNCRWFDSDFEWWREQSGMRCEHKARPTFPSNARVPQGNFYVSKGKAKRPGRIFRQM